MTSCRTPALALAASRDASGLGLRPVSLSAGPALALGCLRCPHCSGGLASLAAACPQSAAAKGEGKLSGAWKCCRIGEVKARLRSPGVGGFGLDGAPGRSGFRATQQKPKDPDTSDSPPSAPIPPSLHLPLCCTHACCPTSFSTLRALRKKILWAPLDM